VAEAGRLRGPGLAGPGFTVVEAARDAIVAHRMLSGSATLVVALSGGPDSTCLLDVLARLSATFDLTLAVAHVDHGLAPDSADVSARVVARAAQSGFDLHAVKAPSLAGPNLHARARAFRYGFFDTVASQVGASAVATGHTLDDRVETTLARLIHGGGTDALRGIPPVAGRRIRPLIEVRRVETRAYCAERALEFEDDPANKDPRFERAAIRSHVLAAIEDRWGDGAVRAMATSAARLGEDAAALTGLADRLYEGMAEADERGIRLDAAALSAAPRALRRRLLERAVGPLRDRSKGIDEVLDALEHDPIRSGRFALPSGAEITVSAAHVWVSSPSSAAPGDGA
jgi:tRNA(Ile)-lysidine synthase